MSVSITVCSAWYSDGSPAPRTLTRPRFSPAPPVLSLPSSLPLLHATAITAMMAGTTNSLRRRITSPPFAPGRYLIPTAARRSIRLRRGAVPVDPRPVVRVEIVKPPGVDDQLDRIALPGLRPRAEP